MQKCGLQNFFAIVQECSVRTAYLFNILMQTAVLINNLVVVQPVAEMCVKLVMDRVCDHRLQKGLYPPGDVVNRVKCSSHTISQSSLDFETTFLPY